MSGTKGMAHYTVATKREAVRLHEEEGLTYAQVASQLRLRKAKRIKIWVRQYREEGEACHTRSRASAIFITLRGGNHFALAGGVGMNAAAALLC